MINDLLSASIQQFKADCLQLCEQHYPTVHNRGMRGDHLGKALCRRIISTLNQADIPAQVQVVAHQNTADQPVFRLDTPHFTLWVIAHRLVSANLARRESLIAAVETVKAAYQKQPHAHPHYLILVADHWFDRSKASKEIPAWWLGQLPENTGDYLADGIRLLGCEQSLAQRLTLPDGERQIHHPLKRHSSSKTVHRYLLLTALYPLS
ncbi:hypothetical protein [Photobacterium sp. TY1-4]|uniref:hypothetical protein n=1 Tax=Photobacterium sp. TY1-4 TaxID=2899122 RepID=UPI0021C072BD|nr:hypothetical protein [Photobacterium sp. TY1-4]UXI03824.1 hypothetical protein NH461_17015 [Photobacterium sp. TY1-4]